MESYYRRLLERCALSSLLEMSAKNFGRPMKHIMSTSFTNFKISSFISVPSFFTFLRDRLAPKLTNSIHEWRERLLISLSFPAFLTAGFRASPEPPCPWARWSCPSGSSAWAASPSCETSAGWRCRRAADGGCNGDGRRWNGENEIVQLATHYSIVFCVLLCLYYLFDGNWKCYTEQHTRVLTAFIVMTWQIFGEK